MHRKNKRHRIDGTDDSVQHICACGAPAYARDLCRNCYMQAWRRGLPVLYTGRLHRCGTRRNGALVGSLRSA